MKGLIVKVMAVLDMGTAKYLPEDLRVQDLHGNYHEVQGLRFFTSVPTVITPKGEVPLSRIKAVGQEKILTGIQ